MSSYIIWYAVPAVIGAAVAVYLYIVTLGRMTDRRCRDLMAKNTELTDRIRDMTQNAGQLQEAYLEIEKKDRAMSSFLRRISHDLRTPMNAIAGYSMLLGRSADDPEKVRYYTEKMIMSGQTLTELINDVLDMGSIETGNVKLSKNDFSLYSAFEEVTAAIRPQSVSRHQEFTFHMNNETNIDVISGDRQRLCRILRNLLSNAVKYTPEGGSVDLLVDITEHDIQGAQMVCKVTDTGCGMSSRFMDRLFRPFERENTGQNDRCEGTGLGLCIVKSFVELMGGTIEVESEQGIGTRVTVVLPLTPAEGKMQERREAVLMNGLRGIRFLAAEDNESNAEILYEVLTAAGAECTVAADGQEALEVFMTSGRNSFDIILLDIQMPVMDGYEAAAAIRNSCHPDAEDIVIIAMTADAFEEDVKRAFACGMDAHVAKPIDLEAFIDTVRVLRSDK